jgi:hypothetical protein
MNTARRTAFLLGALLLGAALPLRAQVPDSQVVVRNDENGLVFFVRKDGGFASRGDDFVGPIPMEGTGTRLMWYPGKGAFRAGRVNGTQWNDANVGMYSVALGFNSRANGDNTFAAGPGSTASQGSAVAIGENNTSNSYASVTLGYHAHSNQKPGSFVFGDFSTPDTIRSGANNQATFRVAGGFRVYTNANLLSGVTIAANGSSWDVVSDRRRKENFLALDGEDVLRRVRDVPVTTWNYVAQGREIRHIGPMAQDWRRAFGLSGDSLTINSGDFDGVNLAAAQALERRTAEQRARIEALERENTELHRAGAALREEQAAQGARIAELEARLARLAESLGAAAQDSAKRIRFARGSSSAGVEGAVLRGERAVYLVGARGGQQMRVRVVSPENNAVFQIHSPPGGAALPGAGETDDATAWSGTLPRSGDYRIVVGGTRGNASYSLHVEIRTPR